MSLMELLARADARGLAMSGLACLDRCLPSPEPGEPEPLRTLRAGCADPAERADGVAWAGGADWGARLDGAHAALAAAAGADDAAARVRALLADAPRDLAEGPLRGWADACSLLALDIHREYDAPGAAEAYERCRAEDGVGCGPLVTGELRRQAEILEILAESAGTAGTPGAGTGARRVADLTTEGRRVLRAVMSRRARGRARSGDLSPG
ncbi:hypothetical protein [Streptomyces sp. NPDC059166]|uniref:hypothetical protein n=1 Tax=Streptomyces sp. NPDC059166 TaxID=3346752 RepID=UPI0036C1AAA2